MNSKIEIKTYIDKKVKDNYFKKVVKDKITKIVFFSLAILTVLIIFLTLGYLFYSGLKPFFKTYTETISDPLEPSKEITITGKLNFISFITGSRWSKGPLNYSIGWLIINTLYVTFLSLLISTPLSIFLSLFITRIAPKTIGDLLNNLIKIFAGIPSVIIGVFAMGVILPIIKNTALFFNQSTSGGRSILSGVIVLSLMSFPTMTLMIITSILAVDKKLIMASSSLGASKTQTNFKMILKAAKSGIFAGIILATGRAIGEATAIQMVTGALSGPTFLPFENTSTITTIMLTGLGEASYGSLNYDARFSAGLFLMLIILLINLILNYIKKRIENKQYGKVKIKNKSLKQILTSDLDRKRV